MLNKFNNASTNVKIQQILKLMFLYKLKGPSSLDRPANASKALIGATLSSIPNERKSRETLKGGTCYYTADLMFDWFSFDLTSKTVVFST